MAPIPLKPEKFVVLKGKEVTHEGITYSEDQEFEMDAKLAAFHVRAGSARPFMAEADAKSDG